MKAKHLFICLGALALYACASDQDPVNPEPTPGSKTTSVDLVVPVGCSSVRIDYPTLTGLKSVTANIAPETRAMAGRSISPITTTTLDIVSAVDTYVNIYGEGADGKPYLLVGNLPVAGGSSSTTRAGAVTLPEDAVKQYVTTDGPFTFYHSSGVAMFDDSWPKTLTNDGDFNDVVIDYDIEAKTVDAAAAPNELWRECIKVVMHVRATGGGYPDKAGLLLEGLDSRYIDSYEAKLTLGNWNRDIPAGSLSYTVNTSGAHPVITIDNIGWLICVPAHSATYINSKTGQSQVVNTDQRDPAYADDGKPKYYNVNPGYMNTGGDLFTLTVTFKGKVRSSMDKAEGDAMLANFIQAVTNTESQNFFIRTADVWGGYEIHMKGYQPTPLYLSYQADRDQAAAIPMNMSTTYSSQEGYVWGFKTPVLTRHAWEKTPFHQAYPEYLNWVTSGGTASPDWYRRPAGSKIATWW